MFWFNSVYIPTIFNITDYCRKSIINKLSADLPVKIFSYFNRMFDFEVGTIDKTISKFLANFMTSLVSHKS